MCVLILSTILSHADKKWARNDQKYKLVFPRSTCYCCQILMRLDFSRKIFEKHSNIQFHENLSSGSRVVSRGETDIHDETNSRFSPIVRTRLKWIFRINNASNNAWNIKNSKILYVTIHMVYFTNRAQGNQNSIFFFFYYPDQQMHTTVVRISWSG